MCFYVTQRAFANTLHQIQLLPRAFKTHLKLELGLGRPGSALTPTAFGTHAFMKLQQVAIACLHTTQIRFNESAPQKTARVLPPTTDFPTVIRPSKFLTIQNWIFYRFGMRGGLSMDKAFDMAEFDRGARQAASLISCKLASGEYDDLEGLVDHEVLIDLKRRLADFTAFQRQLLKVEVEDVFFSIPYQMRAFVPDPPPQPVHKQASVTQGNIRGVTVSFRVTNLTRYVEITIIFYILRGFAQKATSGDARSLAEFVKSEDRNNVMVCNYRFSKDFTKGVKDAPWIVNMVSHFLPADHQR